MVNPKQLEQVIAAYLKDFDSWWQQEDHKLKALKQFTNDWDLGADDFVLMYEQATRLADQLLVADKGFPGGMIVCFGKMAEHTTKEAFVKLLDESQDLALRIDHFTNTIRLLLNQFAVDNPNWALNIKQSQSISTYLYFAYPERYYVYQKELVAQFASFLNCPLKLSDSLKGCDLVQIFDFFNSISQHLSTNEELMAKGQALMAKHGLNFSALNLLTWDLSCYFARGYGKL